MGRFGRDSLLVSGGKRIRKDGERSMSKAHDVYEDGILQLRFS